jgi:hypothetical protein
MDIKEIRELAQRFSPGQIEQCIGQQIETGTNFCLRDETKEKIINELAKAQTRGFSTGLTHRQLLRT